MGIKIIDMAVNVDHVHIFFQYPPKYSLSYIAKKIKGRSSRILRRSSHIFGIGAKVISGLLDATTAMQDRAGKWWRNTFLRRIVLVVRKVYKQKTIASPCT
jgi:REP element-mobilizing transposase RayT